MAAAAVTCLVGRCWDCAKVLTGEQAALADQLSVLWSGWRLACDLDCRDDALCQALTFFVSFRPLFSLACS